jgi:hypothetical protein
MRHRLTTLSHRWNECAARFAVCGAVLHRFVPAACVAYTCTPYRYTHLPRLHLRKDACHADTCTLHQILRTMAAVGTPTRGVPLQSRGVLSRSFCHYNLPLPCLSPSPWRSWLRDDSLLVCVLDLLLFTPPRYAAARDNVRVCCVNGFILRAAWTTLGSQQDDAFWLPCHDAVFATCRCGRFCWPALVTLIHCRWVGYGRSRYTCAAALLGGRL